MFKKVIVPLLIILASCGGKETSDVQVAQVKRGTFLEELTEQGTIGAVNSISISAPVISYRYGSGALKIAKIVDDGMEVQKGDTIMVFDPAEIKRAYYPG